MQAIGHESNTYHRVTVGTVLIAALDAFGLSNAHWRRSVSLLASQLGGALLTVIDQLEPTVASVALVPRDLVLVVVLRLDCFAARNPRIRVRAVDRSRHIAEEEQEKERGLGEALGHRHGAAEYPCETQVSQRMRQ